MEMGTIPSHGGSLSKGSQRGLVESWIGCRPCISSLVRIFCSPLLGSRVGSWPSAGVGMSISLPLSSSHQSGGSFGGPQS